MIDELLPYYHRELAFIRKMGGLFADANPQVAARLRLSADECQDPHVERLIEAFAFLTARIRHKLDDDFPELTEALLGVLYPHYLNPVPSMAIVQLALDRGQADQVAGHKVEKGAELRTVLMEDECRFRTCYPVTSYPIDVSQAALRGLPPGSRAGLIADGAVAALGVRLQGYATTMDFGKLEAKSLRFYLKGQDQHVLPLYEMLMNNVVEVGIASADGKKQVRLGKGAVQAVGFDEEEGMLPYDARSFQGYRLLTEYFAFPKKFLFVEVSGWEAKELAGFVGAVDLTFYLNKSSADLEHNVSADTFRLGCTPVVNLFDTRAEQMALTQTETEYRVVPNVNAPMANEVYSIKKVTGTSKDGEVVEFLPFYSLKHGGGVVNRRQAFWYVSRRPAAGGAEGRGDFGTEVFLSLVDSEFKPAAPAEWVVDVEAVCLNRDLPGKLGGGVKLQLMKGGPVRAECLTAPTKTHRAPTRNGLMWRLVSHLSLNHLSITGGEKGADALREILRLYDPAETADTRARIESIVSVESKHVVGRAPGPAGGGFCRGLEVAVTFDEGKFSDRGVYLFASVIERFMGLYCSINSFSKMVARTKQREGDLRKWAPRAADRVLL